MRRLDWVRGLSRMRGPDRVRGTDSVRGPEGNKRLEGLGGPETVGVEFGLERRSGRGLEMLPVISFVAVVFFEVPR